MSINSALFAGTSGLLANSGALAAISDNIANVNTVGYKRAVSTFDPLVEDNLSTISYSAGGVKAGSRQLITQQGVLAAANSSTDLGINGQGFFLVTPRPDDPDEVNFLMTRAGSFTPDEDGFLRNSAGLYLQGWPADENGEFNTNPSDLTLLSTVNVNAIGGAAGATTKLQFNANLDSETVGTDLTGYAVGDLAQGHRGVIGAPQPDFDADVQVFDSLGNLRTLTLLFVKDDMTAGAGPNTWTFEVIVNPATQLEAGTHTEGVVLSGELVFRTDGQLDLAASTFSNVDANGFPVISIAESTAVPAAGTAQWAVGNGAATSTIDLGFFGTNSAGGLTQLRASSSVGSTSVDGSRFGSVTGVEVDEEGIIRARFNNGIVKSIYQIPLATVPNPNGLAKESGGAYRASRDSGAMTFKQPGVAGAGSISSNSLESSTVDLAAEFSGLITTQRAYSAASKIITTADEMLEELIRMKR